MAIDRSILAGALERELGKLAEGAGWNTSSRIHNGIELSEGDFTDSINYAFRQLGFTNDLTGLPDPTLATPADEDRLLEYASEHALNRLHNFYATRTDTIAGPMRFYRSQIAKALANKGKVSAKAVRQGRWGSESLRSLLGD